MTNKNPSKKTTKTNNIAINQQNVQKNGIVSKNEKECFSLANGKNNDQSINQSIVQQGIFRT